MSSTSDPSWYPTTLDSVDANYGQLMNWTSFVTTLASSPSVGITDIVSNESVYIKYRDILNRMLDYFLHLPARTQANYIIWRVVDSLQSVLLPVNDKLGFILEHAVLDNTSVPLSDAACAQFVSLAFHLVAYRRHYREHLPDKKLRRVNAMVKQLKDEFYALLTEHNWLDENSSQILEDKIESLTTVISFFGAAMNSTYLEGYYSNVTIDENNFINNVIAVRKNTFAKKLQTIRTHEKLHSPDKSQSSLAYIVRHIHEIYFTSSLLQAPWFVDKAPMSLKYAGTSYVLGHEVCHAVDSNGVMFHKNGTIGNWFGNATNIEFLQRVKCMIDQYNRYFYKAAEMHVNGNKTIAENIADNGGMKLAYRAYRNYTHSRISQELNLPGVNFTNEQVFFLRGAQLACAKQSKKEAQKTILKDVHSPVKFRVNGRLQNLQAFADAFSCPPGTPMNPVNKCEVW